MKRVLSIVVVLAVSFDLYGQISSTWKGGTPGHATDWNIASNWSNNQVPDEFTDVVVLADPTLLENYPVINSMEVEVHSLLIPKGAKIILGDNAGLVIQHTDQGSFDPQQVTGGKTRIVKSYSNSFLARSN